MQKKLQTLFLRTQNIMPEENQNYWMQIHTAIIIMNGVQLLMITTTCLKKAEAINQKLPEAYKSAYFQLVLHPVKASANLNELYYNVSLNKKAYSQ